MLPVNLMFYYINYRHINKFIEYIGIRLQLKVGSICQKEKKLGLVVVHRQVTLLLVKSRLVIIHRQAVLRLAIRRQAILRLVIRRRAVLLLVIHLQVMLLLAILHRVHAKLRVKAVDNDDKSDTFA